MTTPTIPPLPTLAPPPGETAEPRAAAPARGRAAGWAAAVTDPEWPLFLAVLLAPAALCLALGEGRKAGFFFGTAAYVAVLKWLGWAVFGRLAPARLRFLLFPAELFSGLAVLCAWFYLRNLVAKVWPGSYGLRELGWLFPALLVLHGAALARRAPALLAVWRGSGRAALAALGERLAMYAPFATMLAVALWSISTALGAQGTDGIHYTFTAQVYLHEGIDFHVPPTERQIVYPAALGAMNATAAASAPLSVVQAFHLQHVLLCIAAVFLVTGTVAALLGRALPLLHMLPLPFLFLFPLYALYPDLLYPGVPKQVGPPLCAAVCLLPVLAPVARRGPFLAALALAGLLAVLAAALNPACAPFAAAATAVAAVVFAYRGGRALGWSRRRVLLAQGALALAAAVLVLGSDLYYRSLLARAWRTGAAGAGAAGAAEDPAPGGPREPAYSLAKGMRAAATVNPVTLSPAVSTTALSYHYDHLQGWTEKGPAYALLVLTFGAALLALVPLAAARRRSAVPAGAPAVAAVAALALRLALKYGITALAGGLTLTEELPALLSAYLRYVLLRCELLLLFACLVAAGTHLYLVLERRGRLGVRALVTAGVLLGAGCWALPAAWLFVTPAARMEWTGAPTAPQSGRFPITEDDLRLTAWLDDNPPPEGGNIGLAAWTFRCGTNDCEHRIYPVGGGHALPLYGRHYNYRFLAPDFEGEEGYREYQARVRDHFDAGWCLDNRIVYFYATPEGLRQNPGLADAVKRGVLRPVHREGDSCVYAVTNGAAP